MAEKFDLQAIRVRIDALDTQILELLNERARCAEQVAHAKLAEDPNAKFYRPEREAQILTRMLSINQGPLRNEQITHLFREIISSCLALEESMCIAYLGPEGTFTQEATLKHFGLGVGRNRWIRFRKYSAKSKQGACATGLCLLKIRRKA